VKVRVVVLWVMTLCGLVGGYQCVGPPVGLCYLVDCVGSSGLAKGCPCVFMFEWRDGGRHSSIVSLHIYVELRYWHV